MKVLTRYLLRAHIAPFIFAFVALTGVILINTLAKELASLAGKGLPMSVVFEFFVLSLPANIALTLPMAVLVAVLHTFSTLASENEVTALRASGVDLRRVALPLVVAGGIIAAAMVWFSDQVLPASNYRWRVLMTDVAGARPLLALREQSINPIPAPDGTTPYYLEAEQIDPGTGLMRRVSIYDVSNGNIIRTINADSGRMAYNQNRTDMLLTLFDGDMREVDFHDMSTFQVIGFREQVMRMVGVSDRLERTAESGFRTDRDMTLAMMQARIDTLKMELATLRSGQIPENVGLEAPTPATGEATLPSDSASLAALPAAGIESDSAGLAAITRGPGGLLTELTPPVIPGQVTEVPVAAPVEAPPPPNQTAASPESAAAAEAAAAETEDYLETRVGNLENEIRRYEVEIQKKFSIAVASLVFVLLGVPIALRFPNGGIGMVIGISLAVFGVYYVGLIGGEGLADRGYVPPVLAMWGTNIIFGIAGLIGFAKLGYEQGTGRGGAWGERPKWLRLPRFSKRAPEARA